jgi:hypothetical protein
MEVGSELMHVLEFERVMEREIRDAVQRHYPLDWSEDAITHDLMIRFRSYFKDITLYGLRYPIQLQWEIYKLRGKPETTYGDVGVLVRYRMPSGVDIEGAGFLEAKVRGRDSTRFHQIRARQVKRILARSRQTRLLLYDYHAVPVLDTSVESDPDWEFFFPHPHFSRMVGHSRVSHGLVLPLELAAIVNQFDDGLYRFCCSLSHQFTQRYFNLHDLDFEEAAISAVKGFPGRLGSPSVVMVIRAAVLGQELPETYVPNENTYGRLE